MSDWPTALGLDVDIFLATKDQETLWNAKHVGLVSGRNIGEVMRLKDVGSGQKLRQRFQEPVKDISWLPAIRFGQQMEHVAASIFLNTLRWKYGNIESIKPGLCCRRSMPGVGATPDLIVKISDEYYVVEIKERDRSFVSLFTRSPSLN